MTKKQRKKKYADVVAHFGNASKMAIALGVTKQAVSLWKGEIPELRAYQIQVVTAGKFKAANII